MFEVGPGDGYIAEIARVRGAGYRALERNSRIGESMRSRGFDVECVSVPPVPRMKEASDACFLLHVIEHMGSVGDAASLVQGLRENLRAGGVLVVATPDYASWGYRFFDCDYTHSFPFTRRRLGQLLQDHEFEVVEETFYSGAVFGTLAQVLGGICRIAYPQWVDQLIGKAIPRDILNRGLLTFLPCLVTIAVRKA